MNIYVENKSFNFVKKAYSAISSNSKKEIYKAFIINYKGGFSSKAYRFFRRKKIYDIEYVLFGVRGLNKAIKYLNRSNNPISLTLVISKPLPKMAQKGILKAKKTIKIIDKSNCLQNVEFYKTCNKILYNTDTENNIIEADMMNIYKFYEPDLQCKFSSCLGKNYYVDRLGNVHFCPVHLSESVVGNIKTEAQYLESSNFTNVLKQSIEKRENCKQQCKYFDYCLGACPLEEGCCDFPNLFNKNAEKIDAIIKNNTDLGELNYHTARTVVKTIVYGEENA